MSSDAEVIKATEEEENRSPEPKRTPPQKPARVSLSQKDGSKLSVKPVSNGETENEADISSLSSQDEIEDRKCMNKLPELASHRSKRSSLPGLVENSNEKSTKWVPVSTQTDSEVKIEKSPSGAVLDLENVENCEVKTENGYLDGLEMHEFHSSSSATVSCELRSDVVAGRERGRSVAEVKELAFARLQEELLRAQEELKLKDEEVVRLSRVRTEVESELEELTACLFQEAHDMVRNADLKQAAAEKALKEANMKTEVLQAELKALKALVITSTPSMPNKHLHPQLERKQEQDGGLGLLRGHRRSPSHNNLKYGRDSTPPSSPEKEIPTVPFCPENYEIDPIFHREFVLWREKAEFNKSHPFLERIYREDIEPCLNFTNTELADKVRVCVENNSVIIEAVMGKSTFPKRCCLSDAPRLCKYRMKLADDQQWYYISQLCRNRIASVCDFMSYLRYISQGLVRSGVHDVYWEVVRLRREMAMAKLGICS